jgi:hypothetical protein
MVCDIQARPAPRYRSTCPRVEDRLTCTPACMLQARQTLCCSPVLHVVRHDLSTEVHFSSSSLLLWLRRCAKGSLSQPLTMIMPYLGTHRHLFEYPGSWGDHCTVGFSYTLCEEEQLNFIHTHGRPLEQYVLTCDGTRLEVGVYVMHSSTCKVKRHWLHTHTSRRVCRSTVLMINSDRRYALGLTICDQQC